MLLATRSRHADSSVETYVQAFAVLGLSLHADEATTLKAYKTLALRHHPDKNPDNKAAATKKFQEIGTAWETCQEYFASKNGSVDNEEGVDSDSDGDYTDGGYYLHRNGDRVHLDPEEMAAYLDWVFRQVFTHQYSRARASRYRNARASGAGREDKAYTEAQKARQRKQHEEYENRVLEFERECAEEEEEKKRREREAAAQLSRVANAQAAAVQAAMTGNLPILRQLFVEFKIDVNRPEGKKAKHETMLHAAAHSSQSDAPTIQFLLEKGADSSVLNRDQLNPYQVAVQHGNIDAAKVLMARKDVHPSRASPTGLTPLQLAIQSANLDMVTLVLKHATVHDVQRCHERPDVPFEVKEVLQTKKGFVPKVSAQEQRRIAEAEKVVRLAEQKRQAERQRLEDKRLEEERAEEERRLRDEKEEEEKRLRDEQEREEKRMQAEAEELELRRKAEETRIQNAADGVETLRKTKETRQREARARLERLQHNYENELERRQREDMEAEARNLVRTREEQHAAKVHAAEEELRAAKAQALLEAERTKKQAQENIRIRAREQRAERRQILMIDRERTDQEEKRLEEKRKRLDAEFRKIEVKRRRIEEEEARLTQHDREDEDEEPPITTDVVEEPQALVVSILPEESKEREVALKIEDRRDDETETGGKEVQADEQKQETTVNNKEHERPSIRPAPTSKTSRKTSPVKSFWRRLIGKKTSKVASQPATSRDTEAVLALKKISAATSTA